jgi:hypothetical protein
MASEMTDIRIATMVAMLERARRVSDPLVRAQILAETEYQVAWALREAVADCQDDPRRSWAEIGKALNLPRETAWRQYEAGGPLVTVKPWQSADSPLAASQPRPRTDSSAVYAFRAEGHTWFGPVDQLEDGQFGTGWLTFDQLDAPGSRFAGQELLVRYGLWDEEASFHAPEIRDTASGSPMRIRATYEVIDWLFGDGQTALRQAITAVAQAVAITPLVNPELVELVDSATSLQSREVPVAEFVAAVDRVAESAPIGYPAGAQLNQALRRLERAVAQYRAWEAWASVAGA